jgi:hypothetical protein
MRTGAGWPKIAGLARLAAPAASACTVRRRFISEPGM